MKLSLTSILEERSFYPSKEDLNEFLRKVVPYLVELYMTSARIVKVCGSISDRFEKLALKAGFPTVTRDDGRHIVNYVTTADGVYRVDLSAIQFDCKPDWGGDDDDPERTEILRLVDILKKDPFAAIDVSKEHDAPYMTRHPREKWREAK